MGGGVGEWPDAEKSVRIVNCKRMETTDARRYVDFGWTLSKRCPYVLKILRGGGMGNQVEEKLVHFEVDIERARGNMPPGFDRSEMIQGDCAPPGGDRHLWKCEPGWRRVWKLGRSKYRAETVYVFNAFTHPVWLWSDCGSRPMKFYKHRGTVPLHGTYPSCLRPTDSNRHLCLAWMFVFLLYTTSVDLVL